EKENKANMQNICDLLFGVVDSMSIMLIILPLYPMPVNDYVYSVNLFAYTESAPVNRIIYWAVFILLTLIGAIKVILNQMKIEKGRKLLTSISIVCSIVTVLFLAMTREAYAVSITFFLLILKGMLLFKKSNLSR
ncbi:MAG: XRE family transcriptional regulator, partial [Oscillospiraceae bacterium]|nr:XRE family transcriptional regulator [Oscillospiraceae bacterium]